MIPIFKPYVPQEIISDIELNLSSGKLSYGEHGRQFEKEIGDYIGNDNFISTTTFNYALLIVLSALGLKAGDEIIASPVSCLASNQPFAIKNLKVNWVDIDPSTGSMCVKDLKRKINNNTRAVFVNHYCGYIGQAKEIFDTVKRYNLPLIDDAIEAFGSLYGESMIGNLYADATIFSFQTVRLPNTIDGGGISFKNIDLYRKATLIRDYGIRRDIFRDEYNEISSDCDIALEGYGALMSEVNSIIGYKQIPVLDDLIAKQRKNAQSWHKVIEEMPDIVPLSIIEGTLPNYWIFGVRAENKLAAILKFRDKGFYATSVHINNNIYSVFKNSNNLNGVNEFMKSFVAIPSGWWVDDTQIESIQW